MQMRTLLKLAFLVMPALGEMVTFGAEFRFQHHFIDRTLPVKDNSVGDYGLTALVDINRDGDRDFVLGGRPFGPSQLEPNASIASAPLHLASIL